MRIQNLSHVRIPGSFAGVDHMPCLGHMIRDSLHLYQSLIPNIPIFVGCFVYSGLWLIQLFALNGQLARIACKGKLS